MVLPVPFSTSIQQAPSPQVTALGLANEPISHKVGVLFYRLHLCWALGWVRLCTSPFSVHYSLVNGGPLSGAGLKSCSTWCRGSNPSLLREKLWVLVLWLCVTTPGGGRDCVSASPSLFDVVSLSLPWCAGFAQLVFRGFFQRKFAPYVAVDSVCPWEEVSSGSSYVTILKWNPPPPMQFWICLHSLIPIPGMYIPSLTPLNSA